MVKNNNLKDNLDTVGKGILNSLENSVTEDSNTGSQNEIIKNLKETKSIGVNKYSNSIVKDENSTDTSAEKIKNSVTKKKNTEIKDKSKSSFMLTTNANKQLKLLNLTLEKDLSDLVVDAIDLLYKKHEKKVEQIIADYFQALKK